MTLEESVSCSLKNSISYGLLYLVEKPIWDTTRDATSEKVHAVCRLALLTPALQANTPKTIFITTIGAVRALFKSYDT